MGDSLHSTRVVVSSVGSAAVAGRPPVYTYVQLVEVAQNPQQQHLQMMTTAQQQAQIIPLQQGNHQIGFASHNSVAAMRIDPPIALWKRQLRERNVATCVHAECSISFLTLAGIVAHHKNCLGFASAEDYVPCTMCGLRFKQFKSLKSHQDRAHYGPATPMGGPIMVKGVQYVPVQQPQYSGLTFNRFEPHREYRSPSSVASSVAALPLHAAIQKLDTEPFPTSHTTYLPKELEDDLETPIKSSLSVHSGADHSARIMADSKKISTARPRGRPRKNYSPPREPPPRDLDLFDLGPMDAQPPPPPIAQQFRLIQIQAFPPSSTSTSAAQEHNKIVVGHGHQDRFLVRQPQQQQQQQQVMFREASPSSPLIVQLPTEPEPSTTPTVRPPPMSFLTASTSSRASSSPAATSSVSRPSIMIERRQQQQRQASSSYASAEPNVGDLEAKELELADQEAKLRDYERIVLQSELMAKKAALLEREKHIKEREVELRARLAQAVQVLEDTKPVMENNLPTPPPPPPPGPIHRIPSVTPPAAELTSTSGQIDESDSTMSNDETSSVNTTTSRTSRETSGSSRHNPIIMNSRTGGASIDSNNLASPRQPQQSQKQEDPSDDNQQQRVCSRQRRGIMTIVPDEIVHNEADEIESESEEQPSFSPQPVSPPRSDSPERTASPEPTTEEQSQQFVLPSSPEQHKEQEQPRPERPARPPSALTYKLIALGGAGGSEEVQADDVAHILSDDIEIANADDLIEISTDGFTEAVVLERSVDVVTGDMRQLQNREFVGSYGQDVVGDTVHDDGTVAAKPESSHKIVAEIFPKYVKKNEENDQSVTKNVLEPSSPEEKSVSPVEPVEAIETPVPEEEATENDSNQEEKQSPDTSTSKVLSPPRPSLPPSPKKSRLPSPKKTRLRTLSTTTANAPPPVEIPVEHVTPARVRTRRHPQKRSESKTPTEVQPKPVQKLTEPVSKQEEVCYNGDVSRRENKDLEQVEERSPEASDRRSSRRNRKRKQQFDATPEDMPPTPKKTKDEDTPKKRGRGRPPSAATLIARERLEKKKLATSSGEDEVEQPHKRRRSAARITSTTAAQDKQVKKKLKSSVDVSCGKCNHACKNEADFLGHAATAHGGVARMSGESQDFTKEEEDAAVRVAFENSVIVSCYRCLVKTFGTRLGLNYHLRQCGFTKEEIDNMKKPCFFEGCNYRGLPDNLRIHETRHQSEAKSAEIRRINLEVKLIEEQEAEAGGTPGRSKRRAATKANERLSEVVAILKSKMDADDSGAEDIEGGDDDGDDDAFVPSNEIDTEGKFEVKKSADGVRTFHCKICNLVETRKEDMASHLVSEHADDLEGDDDYNGDDDVSDEDDGAGFGEDEDDSSLCEEDTGGGGESLRRRTTTAGARSNRPCILEPAPAFVDVESEFRAANFDRNKFEDFVTSASDWVKVEDPEIFLPSQTTSAKFASASSKQPSTNGDNQQNMTRFSATSSSQCTFMYAGGPIYAAGWCPNSDPSATERFLALSTWDSENDQHSGLIQIWAHDSDSKNTEYKFGIAHPGGSVRSLQWCPSGNQSEGAPGSQLSRIGNLAVASTDGAVRIYSVCHPCHLEAAAVYNVRSVRTLNLGNGGKVPECLKVCWYRGRGHRVIAASFSNGSVALWDLQQPEDSLQRDGDVLFPYTTINAHFSSVTGLDLGDKSCVGDTEFPAKLATGSSDRFCHIWDLDSRTSTTLPSQSIKKGHVSDVSFVKHSPGGGHAAISFDDVFLQSHTQTVVFESGDDGCVKTHPIVAQNSAVLSHSYNPWLSVLVLGTAGGEVLAYIAPPIGKALEHDKDSNRRRTLIYRTEQSEDDSSSMTFIDGPIDNLTSASIDEQKRVRSAESMAMEDITRRALIGVNKVCVNTDPGALGLVFSGTAAGIGRIHDVSALRTTAVKKALKKL